MGSNIYIRSEIYKRIIELGHNPSDFVNKSVEDAIDREFSLPVHRNISSKITALHRKR